MPQNSTSNIPAPPPGFVPLNSDPTPAASPAQPAPPAGFVPADQTSTTQPSSNLDAIRAANNARPWWKKLLGLPADEATRQAEIAGQQEKVEGALKSDYQAKTDVPIGFGKSAVEGLVGADNLVRSGLNAMGAHYQKLNTDSLQPTSGAQKAGGILENVVEFLSGDELLKGLSAGKKLESLASVAKFLEQHPKLAALAHIGLTASRQAVVGGGQAAIHGGDAGDVAAAAGTGLLTSAASEGLAELPKLARPGTREIAGETFETAPKWRGAATAAKLADQNQAPAKRVIGNVAQDAAQKIVSKFGVEAPDTITSFHDAAQAVEGAAKPVFKTLDEISKGQFQVARNEMDRAAKVARRATSMKDLTEAEKAYTKASDKIDAIFAKAGDQVSDTDLQNAKSAWRASKILEKIHSKLDAAFDMPQSAAEVSGADRTLQLQKLQGRLNAAFKAIPKADIESVLGAEGTKNLYDLAELGAEPVKAKSLAEVAKEVGGHLSSGTVGAGIGALAGHALPGGSLGVGLYFLYLHPEAGTLVAQGLSKGLSPKLIVPSVLQLLQSQRHPQQ